MLTKTSTEVQEVRNSRKNPFTDDEVQELLGQVSTVKVARGKKIRELNAQEATLDDLKGPTGNYRAPILKSGDMLLVGFHSETLKATFSA